MRFCGICGAPLDARRIGRERRRVSIVFIDLAGFSNLTHGFDPEELRDLADEILTVVAGVIEDYDGYVDAFQGDGLVALFGAPHSHPDDAQRAVLAAAAGLKAIKTIGNSKGLSLRGRAGVNTGVVIAGSVGFGRVKDYTVMGSAVNLAARLEAAAQPDEVLAGPETYEATRHNLEYALSQPLTLQGFPDIQQAYCFVATRQQQQTDPYADLSFVGRSEERAALWQTYQQVLATGQPRQLWLVGEVGSGKTRLMREFAEELIRYDYSSKVIWLGDQSSTSDTEDNWRSLANQLFDLQLGEDERLKQQKVIAKLSTFDISQDPYWQRTIIKSLGFDEPKSKSLTKERRIERRRSNRAALAWSRLLAQLTQVTAPEKQSNVLLLVIDNSPRDPALEEMIGHLGQGASPIMIVRTSRKHVLSGQQEVLTVASLGEQESLALLEQVVSPVLEVATRSLVSQVGGIPANILELGRALNTTPTGSFSGSLASLLQARLDMLPASARQALAQAALCGEHCWEGLLRQLDGGRAERNLRLLTEENLLVKAAASSIPGEIEFRFQSELLRRAVMRMVPFGDRPALHLRIASWLEQHAPLALSKLIGYHFEQAGVPEGAYPHYLAAAELAITQKDQSRALKLYEHLLTLKLRPELLAQGALAYAQAALSQVDKPLAIKQLKVADELIVRCGSKDRQDELRQVYRRLYRDVLELD